MSGAFDDGYTPAGFDQIELPVSMTISNFQGAVKSAQTRLFICQQCRAVVSDPWMHEGWHDQLDGRDAD